MEPQTTMQSGLIEELCRSQQAYLVNYLSRMLLADRELARELVQDAFMVLHETYRPPAELQCPAGLLFRVATNFALMELRRRRTVHFIRPVGIEEMPDHGMRPDRQALMGQIGEHLTAAIQELCPNQRAVLVMAHVQGMPYAEIAAALGVSVKRVDKHLTAALKACRKRLISRGIETPD